MSVENPIAPPARISASSVHRVTDFAKRLAFEAGDSRIEETRVKPKVFHVGGPVGLYGRILIAPRTE